MVTPGSPTFEHHREPLGIGESAPRVSWKTVAEPGWRQSAYELEIVREAGSWSSGRIESDESVLCPWPTVPLRSRERASVRVRLWGGGHHDPSEWSDASAVEAGLLSPSDWTAHPITGDWAEEDESDDRRPPIVRRAFTTAAPVHSARLYVSAHGLYEVEINGARVGNDALAPGWTTYGKRLRYYTHDVTDLVTDGDNAIGAWLGDGWYRGRLGWRGGFYNLFGSDLSFIAQLELTHTDGSVTTIASDDSWLASFGPIVRSGLYDGEVYDARDEQSGWSSPGFDDSGWTAVAVGVRDPTTFVAPQGPPVRCTEEVMPVSVLTTPSGRSIIDLGQNLVGRLRIRVTGASGETITIRTAEVLQDGELYTRPLRDAKSTDIYTLAGHPDGEEWEPRFTIHGFRFAEIDGWPGNLEAAVAGGDIVARVYHTDMERTGWFDSSNALVNRLHENVLWSMRGNFVDIPTDCPQRDERVGWTGDIQVFAPTASFLYDVSGMLSSWLRDVAVEQLPDGTVPWYVPVIPARAMWTPIRPGAAWGDAAVLTPWALYERFGDVGVLAQQYPSAKAWVDLVDGLAGDDHLWNEGFQLGDWLDPAAPPQDPADATTNKYLVATAYFAWSTHHLAQMAAILGRVDDAEHYSLLAAQIRAAFVAEYLLADGTMTSDAQTAYSLAIQFGLVDGAQREAAGARLAQLVAGAQNRIATGFVGTPLVSDALSSTGGIDTAYNLLLEPECPSWLYPVTQGATTVWERWDSQRPDGTVNPGTMTSFNHYALGAVADWLHRVVAGLAPGAAGYRSIAFRPQPGGGFTHASARHESPYGPVAISWRIESSTLFVAVTVPTGADAIIELPGHPPVVVGSGTHELAVAWDGESAEVSA